MSKEKKQEKVTELHKPTRLAWPVSSKEVSSKPRYYRIHRMNAYEWQAFVLDPETGIESPIGKPDLFDLCRNKASVCMREEGQFEFLANKSKGA